MAAAASMEANGGDDDIVKIQPNNEDGEGGALCVAVDANINHDDSNEESGSGAESEEDDEFEDAHSEADKEEAMPDGNSNADLHALLAYSKSRLQKTQVEPTPVEEQEGKNNDEVLDDSDDKKSNHQEEIPFGSAHSKETPSTYEKDPDLNKGVFEDSQDLLEIATRKLADAEAKAAADDLTDPAYLLKLAEKKVKEAEEKAKMDEEATGNVVKPAISSSRRSESNKELWALLNYSKMRIETGATPQLGKKGATSTQKDDVSVNSKLSKSSKRSLNSKKSIASKISTTSVPKATVTVEGGLPKFPEGDAPIPDVTGGDASVDGSVSLANSVEDDEQSRSSQSDHEDESSDEDEEEEEKEEELPSFLKDDNDVDPEEARRLYHEAKFKAASILSVSQEKLTDVQMLQAIAIAEEAARSGEDKFSTKRSLFKLSDAKLEDLKSFLYLGENKDQSSTTTPTKTVEGETEGWGIGRGRFAKKMGSLFNDFREKCQELDEKKKLEREGQPSNSELLDAAMVDIKKQIDEFESIVRQKTGTRPK